MVQKLKPYKKYKLKSFPFHMESSYFLLFWTFKTFNVTYSKQIHYIERKEGRKEIPIEKAIVVDGT